MKALIISSDLFPAGNAGAVRQECIADMFHDLGYEVDVFSMGKTTNFKLKKYKKINYMSFRNEKQNFFIKVFDRLLFGFRVNKIVSNSNYDVILISSVPYIIINYLKKYKKSHKVCLIHDSVEWYSPSEFRLGIFSPEFISKTLLNCKWIDKNFRVISISNYLYNHFSKRNIYSVRIPFILNNSHISSDFSLDGNKIKFIYAGAIGRKDHLKNFFIALSMLSLDELNRIHVDIYGCDYSYLLKTNNLNKNLIKKLDNSIKVHGRVDRNVVINNLKKSNFTVLFRDSDKRYAKAGFPTKVVESLTYSTPVFCNLSSDLGLYLKNEYNSVICDDESIISIYNGIKYILSLSKEQLINLKNNSFESSKKYFDYKLYLNDLEKIVKGD